MINNKAISLFPNRHHCKDKKLVFLLLLALSLRIIWHLVILLNDADGFKMADSDGYLALGKNIVESGAYSMSTEAPLYPDVFRTPIYPGILAFFYWTGLPIELLLLLQLIASTLIVFYCYQLCSSLFSNSYALLPTLIIALDIPSVVFANSIMTETFFAFFISMALVVLLNYFKSNGVRYLYWSAFIFALATLTRPISIVFPFFLIPLLIYVHRQFFSQLYLQRMLLFICIYLAGISTWIIRNSVYHQQAFISYIGSFNLIYFSAAELIAQEKNIHLNEARTRLYEKAAATFPEKPSDYPAKFYVACRSVALEEIFQRIPSYIKMALHAEFRLLFHPMSGYVKQQIYPKKSLKTDPALIQFIIYFQYLQILTYSILGLVGLIYLLKKKQRFLLLFCFSFIVAFLAVSFGPEMEARFRIPMMPLIALLVMAGLEFLHERKSNKVN